MKENTALAFKKRLNAKAKINQKLIYRQAKAWRKKTNTIS
jgi:hypothetical protein